MSHVLAFVGGFFVALFLFAPATVVTLTFGIVIAVILIGIVTHKGPPDNP